MSTRISKQARAWLLAGAMGAIFFGVGCSGENIAKDKDGEIGSQSSALWGCETMNSKVVCTSAKAPSEDESGAYVCEGKGGGLCPDDDAAESAPGLEELLERLGKEKGDFGKLPWACLLTGKHQVTCARECAKEGEEEEDADDDADEGPCTDAEPSGGGGLGGLIPPIDIPGLPIPGGACSTCEKEAPKTPAPCSGKGKSGDGKKPAPPKSCSVEDWEPYFAKLATYFHKKHGIDIEFPREIFDCKVPLVDAALGRTTAKSTPGAPSCHEAEWELRMQSWLTAVQHGCMNLNNPILVMCEQATVHAPNTGKCNATGAW